MKNFSKGLWFTGGITAVALGTAGIFLPLLPTVPFLLLALYCFSKSSPAWHRRILQHPVIGKPLREYQQYKGIRLKIKVSAITFLWISILGSVIFLINLLWVRILLLAIAVAVTIHILSFKTIK